jgi:hypothetical protein
MKGRTKVQVAEVFHARLMNPAISWWGHAAAFDYKSAEVLQQVAPPVLVLNPQDDIWAFTPRAKDYLRNGRIHDLPGWSHGFLDVNTQEAAALVAGFLDEQ